ncbi:MAG: hypothetical protein LHV69_09795 [Elusimicrobia bacterium]|nr:hypothetical protein [Candidatus Obscuribacterium magneticum]
MPKPIRRSDWQNYVDPKERKRAKSQLTYRVSNRLDVILEGNGELALVIHRDGEYQADTIFSKQAKKKLVALLQMSLRKGGRS